jgi:hypothetical protein
MFSEKGDGGISTDGLFSAGDFLQVAAKPGDGIDVPSNFVDGAHLESFVLVHAAEGAPVPGAISRKADQQRITAAFAGGPVHAGFKSVSG